MAKALVILQKQEHSNISNIRSDSVHFNITPKEDCKICIR